MHARFLGLQYENAEQEVRSLRYIVGQLPQVLGDGQVSSLVDEWLMLKCDQSKGTLEGRLDVYWAKIFRMKTITGETKYPMLSKLVKAVLSLPHGNADLERGFSENKHLLDERSSLNIASVNGMRHIKSYLQRYDGDASKVPLSSDLLRCVRQSRAKYALMMSAEESTSKRAAEEAVSNQCTLEAKKKALEGQVQASKVLLTRAEEMINFGIKEKDMDKVESGRLLLTTGNGNLEQALKDLKELEKQMLKKARH
ncbi:hypothetical protein V5799_013300 [Amblyomma americanum]|uniref:HAT C-terminal dimerisation domain-containing protein n=1 Tax=Amblyomma americanum TaxID=6943 RepID=A0AAQ4E6B2_AMBAM